ncbi:MAG TPA: Rap1a/Tai family immunity protein [Terriglobales bacterium]|nr:Rap1a/Tai family immunity protein [Terriglobales bacterium]
MKRFTAQLIMVVAATLLASIANAAMTGANLETDCSAWTTSVMPSQQIKPGEAYETWNQFQRATFCEGYVLGYGVGVKGTMGADDKGVMGTYTIEKGVTASQVIKVFKQYISNHPEEENKPAGDVLYHAMTSSGLLTVVVEKKSGDQ